MALSNQFASSFIRRLNQISTGAPQRIGFRALQAEAAPAMLIVATLPAPDPRLAEAAAKAGAGAIEVRGEALPDEAGEATLKNLLNAAGGVPVGVILADAPGIGVQRIEEWRSAGIDFIVVGPDTDPSYLRVSGMGKIIKIDHTITGELIRSINDLPFDAVEASLAKPDEVGQRLTVRDMLRYRSLSLSVHKPVLVRADRQVEAGDVAAYREARVEAIVLDEKQIGADKDSIRAATSRFVQAVKNLGVARGRATSPLMATLPGIASGIGGSDEVPEDEPDEDS